jgi:hypothetical protein
VAESGAIAERKGRSHQSSRASNARVPDRVDTAVKHMKPSDGNAVVDRLRPESEEEELPPRDHAELPRSERRNHQAGWAGSTFHTEV